MNLIGVAGERYLWKCGDMGMQKAIHTRNKPAKVSAIHIYSCYTPSNVIIVQYAKMIDSLGLDARVSDEHQGPNPT